MNKYKLVLTIMAMSYKVQNTYKMEMHDDNNTKDGQGINECKAFQSPDISGER